MFRYIIHIFVNAGVIHTDLTLWVELHENEMGSGSSYGRNDLLITVSTQVL